MINIFKVVEEALDAIAHDVKQIHFEAGHLEVKAKVSVSGEGVRCNADHRRGSAGDAARTARCGKIKAYCRPLGCETKPP